LTASRRARGYRGVKKGALSLGVRWIYSDVCVQYMRTYENRNKPFRAYSYFHLFCRTNETCGITARIPQRAFVIDPERMHLVQTYFLITRPLSMTRTRLILGFHTLRVFLFEWLTLWPNWTDFPQTSHFAMNFSAVKKW
jgi:hypothetical protein